MKKYTEHVVVSMTSFFARINSVHKVVQNLLKQSVKPDLIVLYLSLDEFADKCLPKQLIDLQNNKMFQIRFVAGDLKSYKKLVYALSDFPDSTIITVDDDILYPRYAIKELLKTHQVYPEDICAHRIRKINIKNNMIQSYNLWPLSEQRRGCFLKYKRGVDLFFCGCGGVLYPPRSLDSEVLNVSKFLKLCKHQDDVWFWAMAIKNNRKIVSTKHGYNLRKRTIQDVQSVGLWETVNSKIESPNNKAIENVLMAYPEIKEKLGMK